MLRGKLPNALADIIAAREQHHIDPGIADQGLACLGFAMHEVDRSGWKAGFREEFNDPLADGRSVFGWLEDNGIAL